MKTKTTMVKETRIVEKTIYIASDGKEFTSRRDCAAHEDTLLDEKIQKIIRCVSLDGYPPFDGGEHMEHHAYRWYYPVSTEEIDLLNARYPDLYIQYSEINRWICIECNDDDCAWYSILSDCIDYARNILEKLGYEMIIERK